MGSKTRILAAALAMTVSTAALAQDSALSEGWRDEAGTAKEQDAPVDMGDDGITPEGGSTLQGEDLINSENADQEEYERLKSYFDDIDGPGDAQDQQLGSEYFDADRGSIASQASGVFRENTVAANDDGLQRQRLICRARRNSQEIHQNQSGDIIIDETMECPSLEGDQLYAREPVKAVQDNVLTDLSQYGNHGEIVGDVDIDSEGINFGGPHDYVDLPTSDFQPTSNFSNTGITVAAWVRWSGLSGNVSGIWGGTGPGITMLHFEFNRLQPGDLRIRFNQFGGKSSSNYFLQPGIMSVGEWVHVAATYNPDTCIGRLYKNGEIVKSRQECAGGIRVDGMHKLGNSSFPSANRGWDGYIQAFTMWQESLSEREIQSVMDGEFDTRDDRLVGYWVFGERERLPPETADQICRERGYDMGVHHQENAGAHQVDLYCYAPQAPENCELNDWQCTESTSVEISNPEGTDWTKIDNDNYEQLIDPLLPGTAIQDEHRPCWRARLTATCERSARQREDVNLNRLALGSQGIEEQFGDCEPVKSEEGGGTRTETITSEETCLVDQVPSWEPSCSASREVSIKECPDQTQMTGTERNRAGCDGTEVCESAKCVASPDYEAMCEGRADYNPQDGQCRASGGCPDGGSYNASSDRCEKEAESSTEEQTKSYTDVWTCLFDRADSFCHLRGYDHGWCNSATVVCVKDVTTYSCPDGYSRDGDTCYTQPDCPSGTSYAGGNTCEGEPSWQEGCPSHTDYDGDRTNYLSSTHDRGLCVTDPTYQVLTDSWDNDSCMAYLEELEAYPECEAQTWNDWSGGGAGADGGSCNASFDGLRVCEGDTVHGQLSEVPHIGSRLPTELSVEEMRCDYEGFAEPQNRCESLEHDASCTQVDAQCLKENGHDRLPDWCGAKERTYECEQTVELEGETTERTQYVQCEGGQMLVCDGEGSCTNPEQDPNDQGFKDWAAGLSLVDETVDEQACKGSSCEIFPGESRVCRTAAVEEVWDCCNINAEEDAIDSENFYEAIVQAGRKSAEAMISKPTTLLVGGNLTAVLQLLYPCDQEEMKLAVERKQNFTVKIGTYCSEELDLLVGSVCIEYETSYCKFDTQMARLMQTEARQQLGIGWGSAKNPDCSGLTPEELQEVDWTEVPTERWKSAMEASGSMPTKEDIQDEMPATEGELQNMTEEEMKEKMGPMDLGEGNLQQNVDGVKKMEDFDPPGGQNPSSGEG